MLVFTETLPPENCRTWSSESRIHSQFPRSRKQSDILSSRWKTSWTLIPVRPHRVKSVFDEEVKNPNSWSVTRTDKLPVLAWICWWATVEEVEGYLWHFLMKTYQARTHNISAMPSKSNIWYIHIHVSYDPHSPSFLYDDKEDENPESICQIGIFFPKSASQDPKLFSTDPFSEI